MVRLDGCIPRLHLVSIKSGAAVFLIALLLRLFTGDLIDPDSYLYVIFGRGILHGQIYPPERIHPPPRFLPIVLFTMLSSLPGGFIWLSVLGAICAGLLTSILCEIALALFGRTACLATFALVISDPMIWRLTSGLNSALPATMFLAGAILSTLCLNRAPPDERNRFARQAIIYAVIAGACRPEYWSVLPGVLYFVHRCDTLRHHVPCLAIVVILIILQPGLDYLISRDPAFDWNGLHKYHEIVQSIEKLPPTSAKDVSITLVDLMRIASSSALGWGGIALAALAGITALKSPVRTLAPWIPTVIVFIGVAAYSLFISSLPARYAWPILLFWRMLAGGGIGRLCSAIHHAVKTKMERPGMMLRVTLPSALAIGWSALALPDSATLSSLVLSARSSRNVQSAINALPAEQKSQTNVRWIAPWRQCGRIAWQLELPISHVMSFRELFYQSIDLGQLCDFDYVYFDPVEIPYRRLREVLRPLLNHKSLKLQSCKPAPILADRANSCFLYRVVKRSTLFR